MSDSRSATCACGRPVQTAGYRCHSCSTSGGPMGSTRILRGSSPAPVSAPSSQCPGHAKRMAVYRERAAQRLPLFNPPVR